MKNLRNLFRRKSPIPHNRKALYTWALEVFERDTDVPKGDWNDYHSSLDKQYKLISPKGREVTLTWLEINVLEEYMQDWIDRKDATMDRIRQQLQQEN